MAKIEKRADLETRELLIVRTFMKPYSISLLPGDGIGPECMDATRIVLDRLTAELPELKLEYTSHHAGAERYRETGVAMPDEVLQDCVDSDAVLLSAIGLPDVRQPDGTEVQPTMMVGLRRAMSLHSAVRSVKLYPGAPCPLKNTGPGIDFVVIRENLEGLFASFGGGSVVGDDVATDTLVVTRKGTAQVVDYAFHLAARRNGRPTDGKKIVTCVDKANVFRSLALFRKVFFDVAASHPDIHADAVYVDAMSYYMVQNPWEFDVLVMENQFGDILSDLGAGIVGGLGLGPSGEIGNDHALFQPSHGTAPTIAGKNIANPLATILSAGMMLDWIGDRNDDQTCVNAAVIVEQAVARVLSQGTVRTPRHRWHCFDDGSRRSGSSVSFRSGGKGLKMSRFTKATGIFSIAWMAFAATSAAQPANPTAGDRLVFAEQDGLVAVEAEHFFQQASSDIRGWYLTSSGSSAKCEIQTEIRTMSQAPVEGAYLELLPDTRRTHGDKLIRGTNFSPQPGKLAVLHYKVHFQNPGSLLRLGTCLFNRKRRQRTPCWHRRHVAAYRSTVAMVPR